MVLLFKNLPASMIWDIIYRMKFIFCLLLFASLSLGAHEVHILGHLSPAGNFEITSKRLYGDLVYIKKSKIFRADRLSLKTNTLDTGISLRNEHLHKYLNAKDQPRIFIREIVIANHKGKGKITINGVEKEIFFSIIKEKDDYISQFKIRPSDYKLKPARFMGVTVKDNIDITVRIRSKEILGK